MSSEVSTVADDHSVEALRRELAEAREQQAATGEILRIISTFQKDSQPVLDAIVTASKRLLRAHSALVTLVAGDELQFAACTSTSRAADEELRRFFPLKLDGVGPTVAAVRERTPFVTTDTETDARLDAAAREVARRRGYRSILIVPLLRSGTVIGTINIARSTSGKFTEADVAILKNFADQAVIAIENTRLFEAEQASKRELTQALEYQTATSDVLGVIAASPTNIRPVLQTLVDSVCRLCAAYDGIILLREGDWLQVRAHHGPIPVNVEKRKITRDWVNGRCVADGVQIHVEDLQAEVAEYPEGAALAQRLGARTILTTPLMREGEAIGAIMIRRDEVRPFSDKQIGLIETFARQAAIAIENTRLFEQVQARTRQLTESLEQQTATSEVLRVISSSPGELEPVFQTMLANAMHICEAKFGIMWEFADGAFRAQSTRGVPQAFADYVKQRHVWGPDTGLGQLALTKRLVRVDDTREGRAYTAGDPGRVAAVEIGGVRTFVAVPMLKEGDLIGAISLYRTEVRQFTDKQIELFTNFARQAVIAIENTRLLNELRESLQQQTATADVLKVISRTAFELQPIMNTLVESAARLCDADAWLFRRQGGAYHWAASYGFSPEQHEHIKAYFKQRTLVPNRGMTSMRAALEGRVVHIVDVLADPEFTHNELQEIGGFRTTLGVPLLRDGFTIGVLVLTRPEVRPFTDNQIELIKTFADQAVIAIENTRLFEEVQARNRDLRIALEQQTATSELLKVIGRSTFELQPVFDTLAENAVRLCSAERAFVHRFDGQVLRVVATHNVSPELRAFVERNPMTPGRYSVAARAALERRTVSIDDVQADPEITYAARGVEPVRTALSVPMLRSDELLGVIMIYRHEVRPFTDNQVTLIETFADQAAIAIENARLLEELQARNRDLTALGEVGRAVSSTLDLKVVLKAVVDRAVELSGTDAASIYYLHPKVGTFELGETTGLDADVVAKLRKLDIFATETGLGEAIANRQPLQAPDVTKRASNPLRDAALEAGLYAALIVPLLGSEGALGALVLQRRGTGEFPPSVVSLMRSFADQSAIALENARLFEEIARKSRELEIASQHKSQFVANMSHELRTPLAAVLGYAELLQEGIYGALPEKTLPILTRIRSNGKHLLGLINTVLDISKIEAGQFKLNIGEYALGSIVETVMVATESLAATKKLAFKTEVAKGLPYGLGDEQRLTQVLLNLVGNAIKFTDAGEVRIAAGAADDHFSVSVSDTGPGIPAEEREHIFEKFRQVDSSNTRAKGGTGLGLAIAREIVEMHGGRIWVESRLGQGSTFRMELPVHAPIAAGAA